MEEILKSHWLSIAGTLVMAAALFYANWARKKHYIKQLRALPTTDEWLTHSNVEPYDVLVELVHDKRMEAIMQFARQEQDSQKMDDGQKASFITSTDRKIVEYLDISGHAAVRSAGLVPANPAPTKLVNGYEPDGSEESTPYANWASMSYGGVGGLLLGNHNRNSTPQIRLAAGGIYFMQPLMRSVPAKVAFVLPMQAELWLTHTSRLVLKPGRISIDNGRRVRIHDVRVKYDVPDVPKMAWPARNLTEEIVQDFLEGHSFALMDAQTTEVEEQYHFYLGAGHFHMEKRMGKRTLLFSDRSSFFNTGVATHHPDDPVPLGIELLTNVPFVRETGKYVIHLEDGQVLVWYLNTDLDIVSNE